MVSNRILLGTIAFGVSFAMSLLTMRNFNQALLTAFITVPATYIGAIFVDKQRRHQEMLVLNSLQNHIKELEDVEIALHQSLLASQTRKKELESNISYVQTELNQLRSQISERRNQREDLNRELTILKGEKYNLEETSDNLQNQILELDKKKAELGRAVIAANGEKNRVENSLHSLNSQVAELQQQKQDLESNVTLLNRLKPQLEEKLHELRLQIQTLETQTTENLQLLQTKTVEKAELQTNITSLQSELTQLQTQVAATQQQLEITQAELITLANQKQQLDLQIQPLKSQIKELQITKTDINQSLSSLQTEQQEAQVRLDALRTEIDQLQEQLMPLYEERDQLLNSAWELPQQIDSPVTEQFYNDDSQEDTNLFPFSDLLEIIDAEDSPAKDVEHLTEEWMEFIKQLPSHQIQVLQAILEQNNPNPAIKKIAEDHITMPTQLIDSINELANNTIGDLIIDTTAEQPLITVEYASQVRKVIEIYPSINSRSISSN